MFYQYDPARVIATFRGVLLVGVKDGTFLQASRNADTYSMDVGATGDVTRVRSRNATGRVTCTLMQSSPANDFLSAAAALDELTPALGFGPILIQDLNGTTICEGPIAWIVKPPELEWSDQATGRQWAFDVSYFITFTGGSNVLI